MRKNAILKHAIAAALMGSGGLFSTTAWGAFCSNSSGGNWDNSAIWSCGHVPTASDDVGTPFNGSLTISLGGANAQVSNIYMCGGTLSDTGGGSLTINGSNLAVGYSSLSFTSAPITFATSSATVDSYSGIISLVGTAANPIRLSANGSVDFRNSGTYTLNYVHFASGTWTQSATNFTINNCTYAAGVIVPATWGCTLAPPTAPTGLTATPISATQIDLAWADNSSDETGFKIFRDGVELTPSPKVGANATATATYSDTGLTCGTTYTYEVKATNANGDSTAINKSTSTSACVVSQSINFAPPRPRLLLVRRFRSVPRPRLDCP